MEISIKGVHKEFGSVAALRGVDLDIASGELVALLGPSGSGKTTLLRLIAGLEYPEGGQILFGGEDASLLPVKNRNVGFVFQHYALFRHMTVADNISFGLRVRSARRRPAREAIDARVRELLSLVQLPDIGERYPHQLSGGQRQRVALARAMAIDPAVLLLDEPFGALDAQVRKDLRRWLRELHAETRHTTVFVTHDQEEALELADRVVVMNHGVIEQSGRPEELYRHPSSAFVFGFLGSANIFPARVSAGAVHLEGMERPFATAPAGQPDGRYRLFVRPHDLRPTDQPGLGFVGVVQEARFLEGIHRIAIAITGRRDPVELHLPAHETPPAAGSRIHLASERFGLFAA